MKKRVVSKTFTIIFIVGTLIFMLCWYKYQEQSDNRIKKNGIYCVAIINNGSATKLGSRNFYYTFKIGNVKISYGNFVSQPFYNNHQIGDTIIIKFLPNDPSNSIIIESEEYKTCYGLPPTNGWKELPKCK